MIRTIGTHRVDIRQYDDGHTAVTVDGTRIKRVREIIFHQSVDELPVLKLNIFGAPTLNMDAFVEIETSSDEYLKYLDEKIENSEGDVKYALMECRGRYKMLLG